MPDDLYIAAKHNARDTQNFIKYGDFKCRFQSSHTTIIVDGKFIYTPIVEGLDNFEQKEPNTVHCKTPNWPLDEGSEHETVKLDITVNGQFYSGNIDYTFTKQLVLHRDVPMSGSIDGATNTLLIGQGFRSLHSNAEYNSKWGPISTDVMTKPEIADYSYSFEGYLNTIPGSESISGYWYENNDIAHADTKMDPAWKYQDVYKKSPQILNARPTGSNTTFTTHYGGPWYIELGREKVFDLESITNTATNSTSPAQYFYHDYLPSAVEFYEYKKETLISIRPQSGISKGGTPVEVTGWDFRYMPEYGVVPHCKFGDKIVRAKFFSTVRLVCIAPPNDDVTTKFPFEVSLNGVDWTSSGLTYNYYEEPILNDVFPDGGDSKGGTDVYFLGAKFTNITDRPQDFNCKFTPTTIKASPKIMPAKYLNSTTVTCKSPGGWSKGDKMKL